MRSRLAIAVSAWLLGALAATCGSMLAVSHLAHGLLGPGTQQLSTADVRNDLASYQNSGGNPTGPATVRPAPSGITGRPARPRPTAAPTGTWLVSRAGSAMAACESGLAYLQLWTPEQGYQADDVFRGPAARATLVFEDGGAGIRMVVSCAGGVPVAQLSNVSPGPDDDGTGHDH